jgi:hypothetical protein
MKPSERIKELTIEIMNKGIDSGFYGNQPQINHYVTAIIKYLDEEAGDELK